MSMKGPTMPDWLYYIIAITGGLLAALAIMMLVNEIMGVGMAVLGVG